MKIQNKTILLLGLILVSSIASTGRNQCSKDSAELIKLFDSIDYDDTSRVSVIDIYEDLSTEPYESMGCILDNLVIINKTKKILTEQKNNYRSEMKVINLLRAARYITGLKMFAEIQNYKYKVDEWEIFSIGSVKKERVPFFAVRMSRDTLYIAPEIIQQEIIKKWRAWYIDYGASYNYKANKNSDPLFYYF